MEIRLLGHLEVMVDGVAVPLGGPRQRAVLGVLALHANETVSTDRLVDDVWSGDPPATAVATLQRYVSHLRRALEGLPAVIETCRPGYVLRVPPELIDARRFERLADEARVELWTGSVEHAAAALRDALALWRGEPLADFAYEPFAQVEITRLQELRSTALELRIDADLALGRHREVVAELEALVAAHPLRESYRGQLMRALHGAGRRADALRVYSEGRRILADELGLDPSGNLQQLEAEILLKEPAVDVRTPSPASRLPAELTSFVGRVAEVRELRDLLWRARLVTLTGPGGSGKSRLALRMVTAAVAAPDFPTWFVELSAVTDAAVVDREFAAALGLRDEPNRPVVDVLLDTLRTQRCLLVVDGCEHLLDAVVPLVERLLSGTSGVHVLATSREVLDLPGETVFRVPPLPVPGDDFLVSTLADVTAFDGVRLFLERAAAVDAGFHPRDEDAPAIAEVCRRLDGLPLALELAAARIDVLTPQQLAERLDDRFGLLGRGGRTALPRHRTLRAMIEWSYHLLDDGERLLFDRLSVFAGSFTVETAEAVCAGDGLEQAEVFDVLARLVRKSLVVRVDDAGPAARYRLLDSLRDFGRDRLREQGTAAAAHRRHADWFTGVIEQTTAAVRGPGAPPLLEELDTHHVEFQAALGWLLDVGDGEGCCRLAVALAPFWDTRYHVRDGRMFLDRALAAPGPPSPARVAATVEAAYFALMDEDHDTAVALCDAALRLLDDVADQRLRGRVHVVRAEVARFQDEPDLARQLCEEAIEAARRCNDAWHEADAHRILTLLALDRGDVEAASTLAEECRRLFSITGDVEKTAGGQALVAAAAMSLGYWARAAELYEESLARFQQVGDPFGLQIMLFRLAEVALLEGDYEAAAGFAEECRLLCEKIGFLRGIARAHQALACAALGRGDLDRAQAWSASAVVRFRERGFAADLAEGLATAARVSLARGDVAGAEQSCDEGLRLTREGKYAGATARVLCLSAGIHARQGRPDQARACGEEALALFDANHDQRGRGLALLALADAAVAAGRHDAAVPLLSAACATGTFAHRETVEYERLEHELRSGGQIGTYMS